jgi:hypothetical protein
MNFMHSKTMAKPGTLALPLVLSLGLTACGGGGGTVSMPVLPVIIVPIPASSYAAGSAELGGYTVLQQARVLCEFGALRQDTRLDAAALSHSRYLTSISIAGGTSVLSHFEVITTDPYHTGYAPWDRTLVTGYGSQVAEILEATVWNYDINNPPVFPTLEQRGAASMVSLLNTVYHLTGAMYDGADVGFGTDLRTAATGATTRREEYRFGSLNGYQTSRITFGAGKVATYPCQGSSNIPPAFVPANEAPNPFPALTSTSQSVGPPIYLKVDAGQVLTVTANSVSHNGTSVPTMVLTNANDPNIDPSDGRPYIGLNEAFVVPTSALLPHTLYQVSLAGTVNNVAFSRSFSMSTGP